MQAAAPPRNLGAETTLELLVWGLQVADRQVALVHAACTHSGWNLQPIGQLPGASLTLAPGQSSTLFYRVHAQEAAPGARARPVRRPHDAALDASDATASSKVQPASHLSGWHRSLHVTLTRWRRRSSGMQMLQQLYAAMQ